MKVEDALRLAPQVEAFVRAYNRHPSLNSDDANEKHLAQVQAFLTAQRAKWEREKLRRKAEGATE